MSCDLYPMQLPSIKMCSPLLVFLLEVPYIHPWRALQYTKITLKNSSLQVYTGQYVTVQYFYLVPICPQISHGFFWFGLNSSLMIVKWSSWVASPVDQYKQIISDQSTSVQFTVLVDGRFNLCLYERAVFLLGLKMWQLFAPMLVFRRLNRETLKSHKIWPLMNCFFLLKNTVVSYFACKTKGEF